MTEAKDLIGKLAPDFCLESDTEGTTCLKDFKGKWVVLYFYPKDNTKGCTTEAVDFTTHLEEFTKLDATIIGISPDSVNSHKRFREKHGLKILLLSDPEHHVLKKYGAWGLKKMYGREYYGVIRSTFIIDPEGKIVEVYPKVRVKGHAEEVLKKLKELQNPS